MYLLLTLPKGTLHLANRLGWGFLASFAQGAINVNTWTAMQLPAFPDLMRYTLYAMAIYLISLFFLALRHGHLSFFGWGTFVLAVSTAVFHLIAWAGYIIVTIVSFLFHILSVVFGFIRGLIGSFLGWLLDVGGLLINWIADVLRGMLGALWWVGAVLLVVLLAVAIAKVGHRLVEALRRAAQLLAVLAVAAGVGYLFYLLGRVIAPFVVAFLNMLVRVILFIKHILGFVVLGAAVLVAIATVGQLLLDQVKGAFNAGNRRLGIIIGAIAIGTSVAILLLISNTYDVDAWLPYQATDFVATYLRHTTPVLDALITLGILSLSVIGVWRNVPSLAEEPTVEEFGKSLVYSIVGVVVGGALVAVATQTEE
jgi:hypothetical protein